MLKRRAPWRPLFRLSPRKIVYCSALVVIFVVSNLALWIETVDQTLADNSQKFSNYVHDPFILREIPPIPFNMSVCDQEPGTGEEGPAGVKGLYKIKQGLKSQDVPKIRLLCMVYSHSNRHDVVRSLAETYGRHCDGFWVASNLTDISIGAYALPHTGSESYDNMYIKIRAMWFYVYQHFLSDFDFFHIGGDDMYVIPENLKRLTSKYPPDQPVYLGGSIPNYKNPKRRFCGGGAGYSLSRPAVQLLVQRFTNGECPKALASDEDVRVGRCLEDAGVKCQDTNDESEEVRYHHLDVHYHASWVPTRHALWSWEKLQFFHNIRGNQTQLGQISRTSTTFHLDKTTVRSLSRDRGIRRYHAILWDLCGEEFASKVERAAKLSAEERKELKKEFEKVPKVARASRRNEKQKNAD